MPPTMVTRDLDAVKDFHRRHGALVIEPLHGNGGKAVFRIDEAGRSEEQTSELQSLMRISYAVFCLKKKKQHTLNNQQKTTTALAVASVTSQYHTYSAHK